MAASNDFDIQGHRGARGRRPENTLPAFRYALELGVRTLEMDTVISRDRRVVVSHEPWMSGVLCRTPSGRRVPLLRQHTYRLYEMDYDEIARYDCGSRRHPRFSMQQPCAAAKPLLEDVIREAEGYVERSGRPPVFYNIETKSQPVWDGIYHPLPREFTQLLHDVLVESGVRERATLQSFDVRTLQAAREIDPQWRLSLLIGRPGFRGIERSLAPLGFTPDIFSPDHRLLKEGLVVEAHARGMDVLPWTVNRPDRMRTLIRWGIDGLITDFPDVAIDLVATEPEP